MGLFMFFSSISSDVTSVDKLLRQVLNQCQNLIQADRASLFLIDMKTNQLYSRLFNVSNDKEMYFDETKLIRWSDKET